MTDIQFTTGFSEADTQFTADRIARDCVLENIEGRVLWLATAMIDHANRGRPNPGGVKVGGHQASSASMVSIMTTLWFERLMPGDRVSVKPHASPVLHSINYLLGLLDKDALTTLRQFGGLQSYPSRSKDPDPVDYSTGSVGIGATAPLWGAIARRYAVDHGSSAGTGRQYSLLGDAELDEGAVWEAIGDPAVSELGEVVWIVDFNRQSLDRVIPEIGVSRLMGMFAAAGWQTLAAKYGRTLEALFERPGGAELRARLDSMSNPEFQRLLRCSASDARVRLCADADRGLIDLLNGLSDDELLAAVRNLGGHDIGTLRDTFDQIDDTRPTIIFAYTIKGRGLPSEGHPQNHSALISEEQLAQLQHTSGISDDDRFAAFEPGSDEHLACLATAARLERAPVPSSAPFAPPSDLGWNPRGVTTTQATLGRTLMDLTRRAPELAERIVTVSPDVSSSTNLGGWVNKVGVWATRTRPDWFDDDPETILHWRERSEGQHVELGIAETNLVGMLGELGATWSRWGFPLIPIGVMYDPFVARALEPWTFGVYAGGQSILVGTPSGVTLAAEGGAHQSITTPSIGLEQPGVLSYEPAFALDLEWALLECMRRIGTPDGTASYLRLSTRPIDQSLAAVPTDATAREIRRRQVIAGGYPLRRTDNPRVTIAAMGALVPEALTAADRLAENGIQADVICVTNAGLLFEAQQARRGLAEKPAADGEWILRTLFPEDSSTPLVTLLDGHPHTLAFLGGLTGGRSTHLGVTRFGQSGDLESVYRYHGIDADSVVAAALGLV